jgi:hypothetical protein
MKHARDMSEAERTAALIRGAKPLPPKDMTDLRGNEIAPIRGSSNPTPPPAPAAAKLKMAKDMSREEQEAFLENHKRKFK